VSTKWGHYPFPDLSHNGGRDAFVAMVQASGTGLAYSGYIGGDGIDEGLGIAVDSSGNAYVAGWTFSTKDTFPETLGPILNRNLGGEAFVAKVQTGGASLVYCGYIGGGGDDYGTGITVRPPDLDTFMRRRVQAVTF
jgi:hypothetical protein